MRSHIVIPDTQVRRGVKVDHLVWIGKYIEDRNPDVVIHLGDHWDMPSLSSWSKGKREAEGRRYHDDIESGNEAMDRLVESMGKWSGRRVFLLGNHEHRIERATQDQAFIDGAIGIDDFSLDGWEVAPFLKVVRIDGVAYSHFFPRSASGTISQTTKGSPSAQAQLTREGGSCTAGHRPGLSIASLPLRGRLQWGIIAGSCYQHEEEYLSPQGTAYFRGIIVKHEVYRGSYSPMFVSLDYLKNRYGKGK